MKIAEKHIEGVCITSLNQINDNRGAVLHMIRNDSPGFIGFGECYFSEIFPNVIKAWKLHKLQTQNIAVPIGKIKLVIYDAREKSITKGEIMILELGRPDAYLRISIPPGLWYGFQCLSIEPALIVNCPNIPYNPNESVVKNYDEFSFPYLWDTK